MLWVNLFVPAPVSPFVRAGFGVAHVNYKESAALASDLTFSGLAPALGIGGGVSLSLSAPLTAEVFGDAVFTKRDFVVRDEDNVRHGTFLIGAYPILGLRVIYKL